ncbi:MAG TPA: DNA-processing protein DprA, partial [Candidatus Kapabacteria bacterium]|nr:DNA-processing protein DprA [Candidatus Kapabacteria bacterium]
MKKICSGMSKVFLPATARSILITCRVFDRYMPPHNFSQQEILQLSLIRGMTASALRKVIEHYKEPAVIADSTPEFFLAAKIKSLAFEALQDFGAYEEQAQQQVALASKHGVRLVTFWDDEYPAALREIYNPPAFIFVRGTLLPEDRYAIAVVGTRGMTDYGRRMTENFSREFVEHGVTVVSGLARGVDSVAHAAALKHSGRTYAVVASGIDVIAPQLSKQLAEKISRNGAVISEYKMGVKALPPYFPQRNRIISGVSMATLVVESAVDGGAMITAGFALDQNRGIFALPGKATDQKSSGTNMLIKESRAKLVTCAQDVLQELGITQRKVAVRSAAEIPENISLFEKKVLDA